MKSKVIIFTASTGQGHNQVAMAMKDELEMKGCRVTIIEPFKEVSKSLDSFVSDGYRVLATKMPKMYGTIYKMSNQKFLGKPYEKIYIKAIEDKLEEIVSLQKPELIISTHPLIVKGMCSLIANGKYLGPFLSVITDFLPHKSYVSTLVDAYIVGSDYTKVKLVEKGIEPERIFVYGIPLFRSFKARDGSMTKSKTFTVLLMGGSMGVSGIKKVYKELINMESPIKLIVVCGNNESLKKSLEEKFDPTETNKEVTILGFTTEISQYMDISDVIITKPGGLTITEAFAKNIPMVIPFFIPGQEEENAEMLVELGAAVKIDKIKVLGHLMETFIKDETLLNEIKDNMNIVSKDHSLDDAINLCMQFIESNRKSVGMKNAKRL